MAEEGRVSPAEEGQRLSPADLEARRAARRASQQRRRRNSVFQYIAVLFMAAFVLLLYTFMMERRQSQQQIDDLQQSVSTVQSLQNLYDENTRLKEQVNELEQQVKSMERQLARAETEQEALAGQAAETEKTVEAMHWFWQLNDAFVRGRTALCRTLITSMEEAGLAERLPRENITGTDRFSPYDRYMEIRDRIIR